jgi:hypothetical protein
MLVIVPSQHSDAERTTRIVKFMMTEDDKIGVFEGNGGAVGCDGFDLIESGEILGLSKCFGLVSFV